MTSPTEADISSIIDAWVDRSADAIARSECRLVEMLCPVREPPESGSPSEKRAWMDDYDRAREKMARLSSDLVDDRPHAAAIGRLADLARTALRERDEARARIDELERHCAALSSEVHDLRPFREAVVRLERERDEAERLRAKFTP
jgi:hypothetical protein